MQMKCNRLAAWRLLLALLAGPLTAGEAPVATVPMSDAQMQAGGVAFSAATAVEVASGSAIAGASLRLPGRVTIPNAALDQVLAPVEGRVEAVLVDPGQRVRAGQPLLRIRSAQAVDLQRELVTARARAQVASTRAQRDRQLHAEGIIARNRLLDSEAASTEAEAALQAQVQMLRLAGFPSAAIERLREAGDIAPVVTLAAPRAGNVLQQAVVAGQAVTAGDPLLRIASLDVLWIEMQATRGQVRAIRAGDVVSVTACPELGRVIASAVLLDAQSQTTLVRAEMPRSAECLSPNQFVEASISPAAPAGLIAVPEASVVQHAGGSVVFVRADGGLRPIAVTVERRAGGNAWVRGDVTAGTQVASSGLAAIKGSWLGLGAVTQGP